MWRLLILLVCALPAIGMAQLNGAFEFSFTNNPSLWDFSGVYTQSTDTVEFENTLAHAPGGLVTGSGAVLFNDGFTRFSATQTSRGRVSGGGARPVSLNANGTGQFSGIALGRLVSGTFNGNISLVLDPATRSMSGTESATLCAQRLGCRTVVSNVTFALPPNMDGTWSLSLNLTTSNAAVRGTAVVTLSNERTLSFNVRGRRRTATGASRLTLNGTGEAFGVVFPLRMSADGSLQSLSGKLLGQRLKAL